MVLTKLMSACNMLIDLIGCSSLLTPFLVFLAVLLVINLTQDAWKMRKKLPPGPTGIPILGYLPFLGQDAHLIFDRLGKKYGKVFRVYLGNKLFVFINDHKLIRETFQKDIFTNRAPFFFTELLMEGYGLSSTNGSLWKGQRRFTQGALRDVGFAKTSQNRSRVEDHGTYNLELMVAELRKTEGEPVEISTLLACTILNNFYALVAGTKPFQLFDPDVLRHIETNEDGFKRCQSLQLVNFFPWLLWIPPLKKNLSIVYSYKMEFHKTTRPVIAKHLEVLDSDNPKDLIDAYLIQMQKHKEFGDHSDFTEIQLLHLLGDLNGAGLGTTKATLCWFFLAMTKYPHIQSKVQEELDAVIGQDQKPSFSDLLHLPYTEATLMEVERYASILPIGVPHAAAKDTTLDGYFIPEGAIIAGLFWSFHHDPSLWKNPDEFDPNNFLSDDGSVLKPKHFMPFSVGRRICIGEDVAKMTMFLIATHVLQEFTLRLAPESANVEMTHIASLLLNPPEYKIVTTKRNISI